MLSFFLVIQLFLKPAFAEFKLSTDTILSHTETDLNEQSINPLNQVLQLPELKNKLEIRAEVKIRKSNWQALARPRFLLNEQKITVNQNSNLTQKNELNLSDAFIENNWTSYLTTTVGLQVYQWGPAEFLNPSNPFSHFNPEQKNLLYKEKGRALLRANISFNKENSLVVAIEPLSNQEPEWIADDTFTAKGFIKYEKSWSGTLNNIGFSLAQSEKNNFFIGEYFNFAINDLFSIYADIKQQKNNTHYQPVWNGVSYDMQPTSLTENQWPTLAVMGLRFEQNFDLRIEYIFNSAGYDHQKLNNAVSAASSFLSTNYSNNVKRFFKPGLELLGKNYFYTSLRLTGPFNLPDFNFYLRWLNSLQDQSSQVNIEIEKSFLDSCTFYAGQSLGHFESQTLTSFSEFRLVQSNESYLGLKYSF